MHRLQVSNVSSLVRAIEGAGVATQFYMYALVPQIDEAPFIPLCAIAHDGSNDTFSVSTVWENWKKVWQYCIACGINIIGHVSDGDTRLRRAILQLMSPPAAGHNISQGISVPHPLVQLVAPKVRLGPQLSLGC